MARRSTVIAPAATAPAATPAPATPPPAGPARPTRLIRAGPKAPGRNRDLVVGILGILILAVAVAMAFTLPEKETLPTRFKVQYFDVVGDYPTQNLDLLESSPDLTTQTLTYELPDNLVRIKLDLSLEDDNAASLPDLFQVQVYDPLGNQVGGDMYVETAATVSECQPAGVPPLDTCIPTGFRYIPKNGVADSLTISIAPKPDDGILERPAGTSREEVVAQNATETRRATGGTWTVRVTLRQAGDCPQPNPGAGAPDPELAFRVTFCQQNVPEGTPAMQDLGNRFTVGSLTYTSFEVDAETQE